MTEQEQAALQSADLTKAAELSDSVQLTQQTDQANPGKPTKYFVDFENVHGAGLKGVDELGENDEVVIIYSQAAETFHIEQAIAILKSKARIRFLEADAGTRNAADFQLIVALYGDMSDEFEYAIITGDGGFDAAIKMGERMGLPTVRRMANVCGDLEPEKPEKPKSRRSRRKRGGGEDVIHEAQASQPQPAQAPEAQASQLGGEDRHEQAEAEGRGKQSANDQAEQAAQQEKASRRRPRRRRRSADSQDVQEEATERASEDAKTDALVAPVDAPLAPVNDPVPSPDDADAPAEGADVFAKIREVLAKRDIQLEDTQIATLAQALEGVRGRQDFYRNIIRIERQQRGRALYHQVRDSYDDLRAIL